MLLIILFFVLVKGNNECECNVGYSDKGCEPKDEPDCICDCDRCWYEIDDPADSPFIRIYRRRWRKMLDFENAYECKIDHELKDVVISKQEYMNLLEYLFDSSYEITKRIRLVEEKRRRNVYGENPPSHCSSFAMKKLQEMWRKRRENGENGENSEIL